MGSDLGAALLRAKVVTNEQLEKAKKEKAEEQKQKEVKDRIEAERREFLRSLPLNRHNQPAAFGKWCLSKVIPKNVDKLCAYCEQEGLDPFEAYVLTSKAMDETEGDFFAKLDAQMKKAEELGKEGKVLLGADLSWFHRFFSKVHTFICVACYRAARERREALFKRLGGG